MLLRTVADPVGSERADWMPTLSSTFLGKMIAKAGTGLTHILLIAVFNRWIFERKLLRKIGPWTSLAFTPWILRGCGDVAAPQKTDGGTVYKQILFTYSMVQSPSWEANWFAASQEIPRISRNPKVHYRTHKRPPPVSILGQPNPVHIPTSHLLEIHPNIIQPSTARSPQWSPSLRLPHQDLPLLTHTRHMHKQILKSAKLKTGKRSQETELTGRSPLRRCRSVLDCSAV